MEVLNWKRPTAIKGTMNHARTSFSTEIFAGAKASMVQYLLLLRYSKRLLTLQMFHLDADGSYVALYVAAAVRVC
jgi:hypothetical protein